MGKILLLIAFFFLVGCDTVRLTQEQAKQLSQAKADTEAARLCTDLDARSALFQAVGARLMSGLADVDLPPPFTPASALVDPAGQPTGLVHGELEAAKAAEEAPPSGWLNLALGAAGGLALTVLSVLRFSPGAFGLVANLAHTVLAPKATREMRAVQVKATAVAEQAIQYGHQVTEVAKAAGLGPTVIAIQEEAIKVQDKLGLRPQVQAILAGVKAQRASGPQQVPA
jgi:hypothetical protein